MRNRWLLGILAGVAMCAALGAAVVAAAGRAEKIKREAAPVAGQFFEACRARDYGRAHRLLSPAQAERLSQARLRERWAQFEAGHGPLLSWQVAVPRAGFASSTNLWPPWLETTYLARGAKSPAVVQLRLVPVGDLWRIEKMNIQR